MAEGTSILELILRIRKSGSGAKDAQKEFKDLKAATAGVKTAMGGFALGLGALAGAYALTVQKTLDYAKEVRDLGRSIGATAGETSKLIQAADDVGISTETLERGLKAAIARGVRPSIEGIGELAEKYNSIQDPIERTEFLIKTFGKSGADLAPLLEKGAAGIKELGDAAEATGLVLSEQDVKAARELEIAIDDLTDTFNGLVTQLSLGIIPTLVTAAKTLQLLVTWDKQVQTALRDHARQVALTDMTYEQYTAELQRAAKAAGLVVDAEGNLTRVSRTRGGVIIEVIQANYQLAESERDAARAADELAAEQAALISAMSGADQTTGNLWGTIDIAAGKMAIMGERAAELAQHIQDVEKAQMAWSESTATDLVSGLKAAEVTGTDLDEALKIIDQTLGTSKAQQEEYERRLEAITDEYKKSGDVNTFRASIEKLTDEFGPAAEEARKAREEVLKLNEELARLPPITTIRIITSFETVGAPPPPGTTPPPGGGIDDGRQSGGPVIMNERGFELFMPASSVGSVMNNSDMRRLVAALEAIASGKAGTFNQVINTSAAVNAGALAGQARAVAGAFQ